MLTILLFAAVTRLIFLTDYPFVSVGDELRDGGLDALRIVTGSITNIMDYGRYNSHGLIIPAITTIFYSMFGSSVLVYRLPAAIVSVIDIMFIYFLLTYITKNKTASFLGAMVMVSLHLHMFYSRTEIVVIFSSLLTTMILLVLYVFIQRKLANNYDYIFLGTLLGFTFNFHASVKAFTLVVLLAVMLVGMGKCLLKKIKLSLFGKGFILLTFFLLAGFGPRMVNTPLNVFLHTTDISFISNNRIDFNAIDLKTTEERYIKSLLVWVTEPTNIIYGHYPEHKPLLPKLLVFLMVIGIIVSIFRKKLYPITIIFIMLVLHLTNSAITDTLNADHRLAPLLPIGIIFTCIGIGVLTDYLKFNPTIIKIYTLLLFSFLFYQTMIFFTERPADKNRDIGDYLSMHTIYFLKSNTNYINSYSPVLLRLSPANFKKFNLTHYKEQYYFFFPGQYINLDEDNNIKDNEVYIESGDDSTNLGEKYIKCKTTSFYCPLNYNGNFVIH